MTRKVRLVIAVLRTLSSLWGDVAGLGQIGAVGGEVLEMGVTDTVTAAITDPCTIPTLSDDEKKKNCDKFCKNRELKGTHYDGGCCSNKKGDQSEHFSPLTSWVTTVDDAACKTVACPYHCHCCKVGSKCGKDGCVEDPCFTNDCALHSTVCNEEGDCVCTQASCNCRSGENSCCGTQQNSEEPMCDCCDNNDGETCLTNTARATGSWRGNGSRSDVTAGACECEAEVCLKAKGKCYECDSYSKCVKKDCQSISGGTVCDPSSGECVCDDEACRIWCNGPGQTGCCHKYNDCECCAKKQFCQKEGQKLAGDWWGNISSSKSSRTATVGTCEPCSISEKNCNTCTSSGCDAKGCHSEERCNYNSMTEEGTCECPADAKCTFTCIEGSCSDGQDCDAGVCPETTVRRLGRTMRSGTWSQGRPRGAKYFNFWGVPLPAALAGFDLRDKLQGGE